MYLNPGYASSRDLMYTAYDIVVFINLKNSLILVEAREMVASLNVYGQIFQNSDQRRKGRASILGIISSTA
jgi:hypothetical protein